MTLVYTALVTPFKSNGSLDVAQFEKNIEDQLEAGIHGLVVCGSTGEGVTLSDAEKELLLKTALKLGAGRTEIIMGAGNVNTQIACLWQQKAQDLGATQTLHVTPWYARPPAEGLYAHYAKIAQVNSLPIIVYNVPGRTACDIPVDIILRLAKDFPNIHALKECNLEPIRLHRIMEGAPKGFKLFSGEDAFTLPLFAMGGHGLISVWSNLAPKLLMRLVQERTTHLAAQVSFLSGIWPSSPNPIPIKTSMGLNEFRLPLWPLSKSDQEKLQQKAREILASI